MPRRLLRHRCRTPITSLRLGIDGFGRIGRRVFRAAVRNFANDIEVVGINDLLGPDSGLTCCAYISTGGGAFEVLEGKTLPAFEILQKRAR